MQFVYTNYVYINTREIKGKLMFAFGPYIPSYNCCSNPFGATIANPRINFALGVAAATSMPFMPVYTPCMPIFGFGFGGYNYNLMPTFGTLTTGNLSLPTHNYLQYFNRVPQIDFNLVNYNKISSTNSGNPFAGYFNNTSSLDHIIKYYNSTSDDTETSSSTSNNSTSTSSTTTTTSTTTTSAEVETEEINTDNDTDEIATDGQTLNRTGSDYGPEFLAKVKQIAQRIDCDYRDLLGLMNSESGIRADIKNPNGSASGLIQFIESTAKSLGTTTAELRAMNPIDQLDYVEKYLVQIKAQAGLSGRLSAGDLYSLVFLPGRAHRDVLTSSGEKYYAHNRGLDLNKDGQITKAELGQRVHNKYVSDNSFLA